jgi:aspartyl protease family protein
MRDQVLGSLYLLMAAMIVLSALISRRTRGSQLVVMGLAWVAIFAGGFIVFTFRDDLGYLAERLRTEATGAPLQQGDEIRIPMAIDGHFWVDGKVNDEPVRFLVDSGATMTTIGRETAQRAGLKLEHEPRQLVRTGNGIIRVTAAKARDVSVGPIERDNLTVHVADDEDFAVLGMNYLSTLERWSVEGRWLILQP